MSDLASGGVQTLIGLVITQAVMGVVFLVGFVAISKRFMTKEVPGMLAQVHEDIGDLKLAVKEIAGEVRSLALASAGKGADVEARLRTLERSVESLHARAAR